MVDGILKDKEKLEQIQRVGEFYGWEPGTPSGDKFAKEWARHEAQKKYIIEKKAKEERKAPQLTKKNKEAPEMKKEIKKLEKKNPTLKLYFENMERIEKLKETPKENQTPNFTARLNNLQQELEKTKGEINTNKKLEKEFEGLKNLRKKLKEAEKKE